MAQIDVLAGRPAYRHRRQEDLRKRRRAPGALLDVRATGVMIVHEVTGDTLDAVNTFARPHAVSVRNTKRDVGGEHVDISFPPNSFTVLEIQLD